MNVVTIPTFAGGNQDLVAWLDRSLECVVLAGFLKELDILINHSSIVIIIRIYGEQKCPLDEVDEFLITVGDKTITSHAVVTDAKNYAAIIIEIKKIRIPTEYCRLANINEQSKKKENLKQNKKRTNKEEYMSEEKPN
ncbi:10427_t:CDS:2 [Dentiscutata heterogama]|uniref:10427_t:CDS:1 n=1 Tax=Dentiscutata heterogama TaxID=1316150 RepID=A0ACA9NC77_9GLOM|nr:10427_t:CDS:2 [Dentiscutata heterogama]